MRSEVAQRASFDRLRYAQCWEDADILLEALDPQPGESCLSIASAGDNTLALLTRRPERVVALDLSESQLAALELRVAAYRALDHRGLLELIGSRSSRRRPELYRRCRLQLSDTARRFWDAQPRAIEAGVGGAGRFERYLALFRRWVLPLVHGPGRVARLLGGGGLAEREAFYREVWDSWRWRALFGLFFSRPLMARLGRDPGFFRYVEGGVAERILGRARHALTQLDPADNPYLQWILTGRHLDALPFALRPENFEPIRDNLDRLSWHHLSLEAHLEREGGVLHRFNLSDIFEYMSPKNQRSLLERLLEVGAPGGRMVYWNMLVPRSRPDALADRLRPRSELAAALHDRDRAFFYSALVIEEIVG